MPPSEIRPGIAGLILAGGQGRRLGGRDKALIDLGGKSLVRRAVERLSLQAAPLALSANGDPQRFAALGLPVLPDRIAADAGPLGGIHAGLVWAAGLGAARLVTVAVDTPFFPADLVERLSTASGDDNRPTSAASGDGLHPTFGLWPVGCAGRLAAFLGDGHRRLGDFAASENAITVGFAGGTPDPFFNINTADDLAAARKMLPRA